MNFLFWRMFLKDLICYPQEREMVRVYGGLPYGLLPDPDRISIARISSAKLPNHPP